MGCTDCEKSATVEIDFRLDGKAVELDEQTGDLVIEGVAADSLLDRMDEAFEPGAFEDGIKSFMRNPVLVYHHQYDKPLGRVLELRPEGGTLYAKAVVRKPPAGSWAEDVYERIKVGDLKAFSVGGKWHRREGPDGRPRIWKADMAELSVTPLPVNPNTLFEVAGKALGVGGDFPDETYQRMNAALDKLAEFLGDLEAKATGSADQREKWAKKGIAMKDGSFPITHCGNDSFSNGAARRRAHQGGASESAIMAHIRKREKALGCSSSDDD